MRYQPKVDLATGEVVGSEALLRWRLPGHGEIAPSQFIPLAEESRLILDIGAWVLNQVCIDYAAWQQRVRDPGRVAINLSLKELSQASFIPRCRSVFERHNVSASCVELEITETTLMLDAERTLPLLDELRSMGIHLSIDDFGTGYSSLSALQQFPISTLKIDRSFVTNAATDPDDATIVRTIIEMGRSLGLQVIAEGIETNPRNYTRFVVIGKAPIEARKASKTSLILSAKNEPGALFAILQVFAEQKINMTKLESRPIPGEPWRYMFYIDIEADLESEALAGVQAALAEKSDYLKILGCY